MKTSELRAKTADELKQEYVALTQELFNLRMQRGQTGQLAKTHLIKKARLAIARIKTVLHAMGVKL
jgi:large subunit ribosomal protein L29